MTSLFLLKSIPYYNPIKQEYTNILTLNKDASGGPLSSITKRIRLNRLSPFESNTNVCRRPDCVIAITKISENSGCSNELMCIDELPDLFEFLLTNGYTIENSITKVLQKSSVKMDGDLICMIKY